MSDSEKMVHWWPPHQSIVFSAEKIFTVEMVYIRQNSRILAPDQKSISPPIGTIKKTQKPASAIVWGAISSDVRTPLVFIDKGVKINKEVYVESILENALGVPARFRSLPQSQNDI
ncbi:hypothetical protein LOD99_10946 [Oopsacas minuta]|uniref:Uncharacterized protein n=1 Tax=Oopsacas minuta TaxID=111878 RepID=A0AAV7KCX7_9METZ|nr:hypothetical protein LOD99_10946 [Oopsacas minuta]